MLRQFFLAEAFKFKLGQDERIPIRLWQTVRQSAERESLANLSSTTLADRTSSAYGKLSWFPNV